MSRGFFNIVSRLLTLVAVILIFTAIWIVYDGINDMGTKADCAVVLGAGVLANGQPSEVLRERLDRAIEAYRAHEVPVIIVSGADHVEGHDEASSMAKYLRSHNVPEKAIIEDHEGTNTDATAHDVARIMAQHHFQSVMVVTSYYHITRTKMALRREHVTDISQAHAGVVAKEDAFNIGREVVDVLYHFIRYELVPATQQATSAVVSEAHNLGGQISSATKSVENNGQSTVEKQAAKLPGHHDEPEPTNAAPATPAPAAQ
jgi:vancomycin permeability regulator SanA